MDIRNLYPGSYASCCYLVSQGRDAVLIDCSAPVAAVRSALEAQQLTLHAILCTHGHFDHLLTANEMREAFGVPLYIHAEDAEMLTDNHKNAFARFFGTGRSWLPAERTFSNGDRLTFGELTLTVMHTPGHSKGSSALLVEDAILTGDTLFLDCYGRTDLYGGDFDTLCRSLQALSRLPAQSTVYPGHGDHGSLSEALKQFRS